MPKTQNVIIAFLVLGLIYAELLPIVNPPVQAFTLLDNSPTQSELLLAFLDPNNKQEVAVTASPGTVIFIDKTSEIPNKLVDIASNLTTTLNVGYTTSIIPLPDGSGQTPPAAIIYKPIPVEDQPFIGDVIPKSNTPLFDAYAEGGRAWYQEGDKVVVIFPDTQAFHSFQKSTGQETDWLQDRLNYAPIDSPGALENYTTNYHGEIVAETSTWALVKFPSGGFLKIAKSTASLDRPFLTQQ